VEEGSHSELLKMSTEKDSDGQVISGFYRFQWESQMEDKSASEPKDMTDKQLTKKALFIAESIKKLEEERAEVETEQSKRASTRNGDDAGAEAKEEEEAEEAGAKKAEE